MTIYETIQGDNKFKRTKSVSSSQFHPKGMNVASSSKLVDAQSTNVCFNCGGKGHFSKECYHKAKRLRCFKCHEFGDKVSYCTKDENNQVTSINKITLSNAYHKTDDIGGQSLRVLVDTGDAVNIFTEDGYVKLGRPKLSDTTKVLRGFGGQLLSLKGFICCEITIDDDIFGVTLYFTITMNMTS